MNESPYMTQQELQVSIQGLQDNLVWIENKLAMCLTYGEKSSEVMQLRNEEHETRAELQRLELLLDEIPIAQTYNQQSEGSPKKEKNKKSALQTDPAKAKESKKSHIKTSNNSQFVDKLPNNINPTIVNNSSLSPKMAHQESTKFASPSNIGNSCYMYLSTYLAILCWWPCIH